MDYFQLFGLEPTFEVNLNQLSATYQALQKTVHPDRFAHSSAQDKMRAVQKSAEINDAFQTLKNPILRGEYLLTLRGVELPSEQQSFADVGFLMQQMELREMLADVEHASDPDAALFAAQQELDTQSQQLWQQFKGVIATATEADNDQAAELLRKLKFYQKLQLELERIEDKLFD
ncbi:co-chaperone HscB [Thalassotalea ponticola]|uniref:co-chaperone HscB n=1 Tax=Thalassotalea ponticola TaxID=1523392 RepID=UPI0025B52C04|nr:co-chaperone HscB [Thalassotalea ponticola]MDN3653879.1 co-chaperone HscB [Thalassotalea ponticola]